MSKTWGVMHWKRQAEAVRLDAAIEANWKELGYGG